MSVAFTGLKNLSFRTRRIIAGVILVLLVVAEGNHYLRWGLFGAADEKVLAAAVALGLAFYVFGGVDIDEIREYRNRKRHEYRR